MRWLLFVLLLCCSVLWISCSNGPVASRQPLQTVVCKYWLQQCHLRARHYCPSGYSVKRSTRVDKTGGPKGRYKEFTMVFYCN